MSSKGKSKIRDSPNRPQKQYYRRILNAIDNIEMVLLDKLHSGNGAGKYISHNRAQTPVSKQSQRTVKITAPQSQKLNKCRIHTQNEEMGHFYSTANVRSNSKTTCINSVLTTPKRSKKDEEKQQISFKFHQSIVPLDEEASGKVRTIRKSSSKRSESRATTVDKTKNTKDKSMFFEWKNQSKLQMMAGSRCKQKKSFNIKNKQNEESPIKFDDNIAIYGNVYDLQAQFEECLMQKRDTNPEEQKVLRGKMQELSYRIAKLRARQSKSAIYC